MKHVEFTPSVLAPALKQTSLAAWLLFKATIADVTGRFFWTEFSLTASVSGAAPLMLMRFNHGEGRTITSWALT